MFTSISGVFKTAQTESLLPTAQHKIEKNQFADFWQNPSPVALTECAKVQHMRTNDWDNIPMGYLDYAVSKGINLSRKGDHGLSLMTLNGIILALRIPTGLTGMIKNYRQNLDLTDKSQRFSQKSNPALLKAVAQTTFVDSAGERRFNDFMNAGSSRLNEVGYTATGRTPFRLAIEEAHRASPSEKQNDEPDKKTIIARRKKARQNLLDRAEANNPEMKEKEVRKLRGRLYKTLQGTTKNLDVAVTDAMHQTLSRKSRQKTWSFLPSLRR